MYTLRFKSNKPAVIFSYRLSTHCPIFTNNFNGPVKAIGPLCVSMFADDDLLS